MKGTIFCLVGALMCAPAFWGCSDEPDILNPDGPDNPGGPSSGSGPSSEYHSWFDQKEEDRWMFRWMEGDDITLRPPGEYTYQIPADGGEFTFWFPDCDARFRYAALMGVVYVNPDDINKLRKDIIYNEVDENGADIKIGTNPLGCKRDIRFVFHNTHGAKVEYVFQQEASSGDADDGDLSCWKSEGCNMFASGSADSPVYTVYPDCHQGEFVLECMDGGCLSVVSETECDGITASVSGNTVSVGCGDNHSGELRKKTLAVKSGNAVARLEIIQDHEGYSNYNSYLEQAELMLENDGGRWYGPRVFEVDPEGGEYSFKIMNGEAFWPTAYYVDGQYYNPYDLSYLFHLSVIPINGEEKWSSIAYGDAIARRIDDDEFDSCYGEMNTPEDTYNMLLYKQKKIRQDFKILPNYLRTERIVEVGIKYEVPNCSVVWHVTLLFIQPPILSPDRSDQ